MNGLMNILRLKNKAWWHTLRGHHVTVWSQGGINDYGSGYTWGKIHSIFCHKCEIHFYTSESFDKMIKRDIDARNFIAAVDKIPGLHYIGRR